MAEKSYKEIVESKRKEMLDSLIESMENNPAVWQKGWFSFSNLPQNGYTGKKYQGLNVLMLYGAAEKKGYEDPRWFTFNQGKELGAHLKAGEKSSSVFFYREYDIATKKDFDPKTIKDLSPEEQLEYEKKNVRNVLKFSSVFNAEQFENIPALEHKELSELDLAKQDERIKTIIANSEAPIFEDGGSSAYYSPATDSIHLPKFSNFKTLKDLYATALHEIAHSTGHASRLNRDLSGVFGSQSYAMEELRAELSSVFMQIDLDINLDGAEISNHASYLKNWLEAIHDDPTAFYKAASDADKICKYVRTNLLEKTADNTKENVTVDEVKNGNSIVPDEMKLDNGLYIKTEGQDYRIGRTDIGSFTTAELPEDIRKSAIWLIENDYQNENDVRSAFYDRLTSAWSDDYQAEKKDNERIKKTQERYLKTQREIQQGAQEEVTVAVASSAIAPITAEEVTTKSQKPISAWVQAKRETRLSNIEKNVPQEMKYLPNWCAFSVRKDDKGDYKKSIWNCHAETSQWAKSNDSTTWSTFSQALEYARAHGCDGLSFALTPESRIFCVDLDDCKLDKKYSDTAWGVYNTSKRTYAERSVSGKGLHFFGKKAEGVDFSALGNKNADSTFEFYDRARFMSITGDVFMDSKSSLQTFTEKDKLVGIIRGQLPLKQEIKPIHASTNSASDYEVIDNIRRSKKGSEFDRMYSGEDICGDRSRTDLKMMNILGYFTNGDAAQMKRIFESSALYRTDKSREYVDRTIRTALGSIYGMPDNLGRQPKKQQPKKNPPKMGL